MRALKFLGPLLLIVGLVSGCTSFKTNPLSPQQAVAGQEFVRLTVIEPPDGELAETIMLRNPWASGVAIGGEVCIKNSTPFFADIFFDWFHTPQYLCDGSRTVALGAIYRLETRSFDLLKSAALVGSILGTFGLLLVVYAAGSS